MGMFDTVRFIHPFACSKCNSEIHRTQTKQFDNTLSTYAEGDFVYGANVITGILKETLYCEKCGNIGDEVYFGIWHSLFLGTFATYEEAEKRLLSMEKTDLLDYILFQQRRFVEAQHKFNSFYSIINQYAEYCEDKTGYFEEKKRFPLRDDLKEYIQDDNEVETLKRILDKYKPQTDLPDDTVF